VHKSYVVKIDKVGEYHNQSALPIMANDLDDFKKERQELIERIQNYETVLQNLKYRIAQLDALIEYIQKKESENNKKLHKKKKK